jgi:hypothetical protein
MRSTGSTWRLVGGISGGISDLHYRDPNDVVVVGLSGQVRFFDGAGWTTEMVDPALGELNRWSSIWCAEAPSEVCLAGGAFTRLYRRTAMNSWAPLPLPPAIAGNPVTFTTFADISGTSETDIWLTGYTIAYGVLYRGFVAHYDGTDVTVRLRPVGDDPFYGIAAFAEDSLLAISRAGVHRYDGVDWTFEESPLPADHSPGGLHATGKDDVIISSDRGAIATWDGQAWTVDQTPSTNNLTGLWKNGPDDIFAGGENGSLVHFDGTQWSLVDVPTPGNITVLAGSRRLMYLGGNAPLELERLSRWTCAPTEVDPTDDVDDDCDGLLGE